MRPVDTSEIKRFKPFFESPFFNAGPMVCFIWKNDPSWSVEAVSKNIKDNFGYEDEDFLSSKLLFADIIHKDDLQRVTDEVVKACEDRKNSFEHEPYRILDSSGEHRWVKDMSMIIYNQEKEITHFVGYIIDISALKQTQTKLQSTLSILESYRWAMDESSIVSKANIEGKITYANENFSKTSGYTQDELIGKSHNIVRHPDTPKELFKRMWDTILSKKVWHSTIKNRGKYKDYWVDGTIVPILDENGEIKEFISIRHDITQILEHKNTIEKMLNTDSLTELGSRDKLHRDLSSTSKPCLVLVNIDRFSQINDFYGHEFGDKVLQAFSKTFQKQMQEKCFYQYNLYRYGGDEFAVFIDKYEQKVVVDIFLDILEKIEKNSIEVEGKEINLNLSCGISFENSSQALLSADMALKVSKKEQKALVVFSEENSLNQQYKNNLFWAGKIKLAIEENRVVPFFQPIVNNKNLSYNKYEALVRIINPNGDVVLPFSFLDIAKQTKQYLQLTKIMIEKSFTTFKHKKDLEFSINLTIEDIFCQEMQNFLFEKLDQNPDIAKRLVLEIVESESIQDYEQVIDFIKTVKSKGCKIAIDDFGSGYSNFEYLIKLQADYIKIDGSLIKNINTQRESFVVVSTIVNFAKQMGIKTIAEFIEDESILKTIQDLDIEYSQGYHFSPPKQELII